MSQSQTKTFKTQILLTTTLIKSSQTQTSQKSTLIPIFRRRPSLLNSSFTTHSTQPLRASKTINAPSQSQIPRQISFTSNEWKITSTIFSHHPLITHHLFSHHLFLICLLYDHLLINKPFMFHLLPFFQCSSKFLFVITNNTLLKTSSLVSKPVLFI